MLFDLKPNSLSLSSLILLFFRGVADMMVGVELAIRALYSGYWCGLPALSLWWVVLVVDC